MLISEHLIMAWITGIQILVLALFMLSTLISFIKQKKKVALYLTLNYFSFVIGLTFFLLGHLNVIMAGYTTDLYYHASMIANVFITAGILFLILFHENFTEVSKTLKYLKIIAGFFYFFSLFSYQLRKLKPDEISSAVH